MNSWPDIRWYAEQDCEVDMTEQNLAFLTEVNIRYVSLTYPAEA